MRKRFFAVFVSLCMIVSMLPANAFAQGDVPSIVTGADGLCEHHTRHDKSCGYGENSPCGYVCGLCGAAAAPAACTCETLCAEGAADGDCSVCAAAGADLSACQGAAPAAALAASPLLNARNGGEEIVVEEVTLTATSESPAYATTDDTGKVTEGGSESSYNIKWDGATLTLNGANIAGGASFSFAAQQSTAAIYREGDLDIVLVGESTAAGSEAYGSSFGVFVENGALSIQGGAGLPPQAARAPTAAASPLKGGGLSIAGGAVRAIGNRAIDFSYGIYVNGSVAISGGTVVATASSSAGRENHGIRLTAPYSEERRRAASEAAKAAVSNLTQSIV